MRQIRIDESEQNDPGRILDFDDYAIELRRGPNLAHLASRELLGGGISRNTPDNLALWLTNPQAAKPGNRMPDTPLSADEARALLAYLETLR